MVACVGSHNRPTLCVVPQAVRMTLAQLVETDTSPGKQEYRRVTWRGEGERGSARGGKSKRITAAELRAPPCLHATGQRDC